jgi:hypothetical protein
VRFEGDVLCNTSGVREKRLVKFSNFHRSMNGILQICDDLAARERPLGHQQRESHQDQYADNNQCKSQQSSWSSELCALVIMVYLPKADVRRFCDQFGHAEES